MSLFKIHRNVMSGQCKGALVRIQVRYTALFIGSGWIPGRFGFQLGLFTPKRNEDYADDYRCTGFWFSPGGFKDKSIHALPNWQRWICQNLSFDTTL